MSFDHCVVTSLPVSLGLQLGTTIGVGDGQSLQAWGRAAWVHEFEPDRSVKPSFQAAPGTSFVIEGASAAEDTVVVNAGLKMDWSSNTSMFAASDGKFGDGLQSYGGDVGLKVNW
ncbi:autotransporter domain-containing protein [Mesorhizobium sp. B3-1-7]|uniref:autotransporter outer membrane beta-barrel domain-containing protein n=1 Tax=Mesorhizobium sp. B3-1-7 TaxID=2589894 RepID=UPI002484C2A8|nr:autotransporter domain-containing protein [Mesorhizobium sp. B3-1-7]